MGTFSWQPENGKVTVTHVTFRVKPLRISGQPQGSSVLIQTRFGRAHVPHEMRLYGSSADGTSISAGPPLEAACARGVTSGDGQGGCRR